MFGTAPGVWSELTQVSFRYAMLPAGVGITDAEEDAREGQLCTKGHTAGKQQSWGTTC